MTHHYGSKAADPSDYRGAKVRVNLTEGEHAALRAESERAGKPMAVLLREAFFGVGGTMTFTPAEPKPWHLCPNEPRCPHAALFHDIDEMDDPLPRCCAEGCPCGKKPGPVTHLSPVDGPGLTGCCRKTPFELPGTDRLTEDPERVTCGGEAAAP